MPIEVRHLTYRYAEGTAMSVCALRDISFTIPDGEFVCLAGRTGSGKTTLLMALSGLVKPTSGEILINGSPLYTPRGADKRMRGRIGTVFQYPESQLFEETVAKDIAFGPAHLGMTKEETDRAVAFAMSETGLDISLADRNPFDLSGGEKRRAAIAGVLAIRPDILLLDEPTAGLDPVSRASILAMLTRQCREDGRTVITVTHRMDDAAALADRLIVLADGTAAENGRPSELFDDPERMSALGLDVPAAARFASLLRNSGLPLPPGLSTPETLCGQLLKMYRAEKEARPC